MEKRKFKRFPTNLTGVIIIESKSYVGHLKNISEEGVGFLSMLDFFYYQRWIAPKNKVTLTFETPSDDLISLDCEIKWTKGHSSDSSQPFVGLKIINPPKNTKIS